RRKRVFDGGNELPDHSQPRARSPDPRDTRHAACSGPAPPSLPEEDIWIGRRAGRTLGVRKREGSRDGAAPEWRAAPRPSFRGKQRRPLHMSASRRFAVSALLALGLVPAAHAGDEIYLRWDSCFGDGGVY